MTDSRAIAPTPVRRMGESDADAVAQVLGAAFREPDAGAIPTARGPLLPITGERVRQWRHAAAGAWVAEVAGYGPVGAVFAVVEPETAWLAGLGVTPGFRDAGVGAALAERALAFLAASGRRVVGMEAAPGSVGAAALYARRGYRVADLTVRLRGPTATLAGRADPKVWRETPCADPAAAVGNAGPPAAAVRAVPRSPDSYLLHGPDAVLLCDPDPLVPAAGGSLDLRLIVARALQPPAIEACVRAAARSALARDLAALELDLALADGAVLRRLSILGLSPIASTIRLVNDLDAYAVWRRRSGPVGRWSF